MFGITTQHLASRLGIPYLFLSPEYQGNVSFLSFLIFGFALGGFFMAFHLYSYILLGPSFPFIATLGRPFYKFSINNSVIPVVFYAVFVWNMMQVQLYEELHSVTDLLMDVMGFTAGIISFILVAVLYFFKTNWDALKLKKNDRNGLYARVNTLFTRSEYWFKPMATKHYYPSAYFSSLNKVAAARGVEHYDREQVRNIFRQNQINASLFEIMTILSFLLIGYFQDYEVFQIPAGASIILLFTLLLMALTIFYSWFKGWAISLLVLGIIVINFFSQSSVFYNNVNQAYGLSYTNEVSYNLSELQAIHFNDSIREIDIANSEEILKRWKLQARVIQNTPKPKLVIINSSGGGIRSAMWTFYVLQKLDEEMDKDFFSNAHLITGASGGMVGASYYRELCLQEKNDSEINRLDSKYLDNTSKDLLNSVSSNLVTHDLFLRYKRIEVNEEIYLRDRGYAFEDQLNKNTEFVLDKALGDYKLSEENAEIPMMVFTPTIINDGRRLVIATQPMAFLNGKKLNNKTTGPENVEFLKLFAENYPLQTKFTSVIRMNATFPYILPMVSLPTLPNIQVMDAGIRDNYGTKLTVRYIDGLKDWIKENTSGIVIVEIRDIHKDYDIYEDSELSMVDRIYRPIANFYGNFHHAQEYNASELIDLMDDVEIDIIPFTLRKNPEEKIALSWHLTEREKINIRLIFQSSENQESLKKLINLLGLD